LFFACMVCHGELARLKPTPRYLTEFYLMIAAGGALGGLFVAIVAPLIFSSYLEWPIGVVGSALLALGLLMLPGRAGRRGIFLYVVLMPLAALGLAYLYNKGFDTKESLEQSRNFFGIVSTRNGIVTNENAPADAPVESELCLVHGSITHGRQFVDPIKRHWPTSYYGEESGVGQAVRYLQKQGPVRVGAIGLGVGTVAAYAKPGDVFRFYEINPEVLRMAKKYFTYLADCSGKWDVVMGDARLSLEAEPPQKFNLLVIDAFSSDSIPTHLLTLEAFNVYQRHLAPNGIIVVHVSNRYLRLAPVVRRLADYCGMQSVLICQEGDQSRLQSANNWVLVTRNDGFVQATPSKPLDWGSDNFEAPLWTDQYSNLFQILGGR